MAGGILLHTGDGWDNWEVQLGDAKSSERGFKDLRFLDATHGWVVEGAPLDAMLFHTTDGRNWRLAGAMETHYADYAFTSNARGVYVMGEKIFATEDGGQSWKDVFACKGRLVIEGLARDTSCDWQRVQFVTASMGFAIGSVPGVDVVFVAKTADGGSTWSLSSAPVKGDPRDAFFVEALTGYVRTGYPDSGQLFRTADGGRTWSALAGSPGKRLQFADPGVGWAFHYRKLAFTTDAGNRWSSRDVALPAAVNAFSLPRRDAAFLVGDHGMVYRYRIVRRTTRQGDDRGGPHAGRERSGPMTRRGLSPRGLSRPAGAPAAASTVPLPTRPPRSRTGSRALLEGRPCVERRALASGPIALPFISVFPCRLVDNRGTARP